MSALPNSRFSWQLDGETFASQIEHINHVRWEYQARNMPPRSPLADDAMDCAWEDSGKGSSVSDVSTWKDPRRLTRSDVMDERSSRWFGIDGFRDDGIEADACFLGLIDEHESSQHQEQQPNTAESSHDAIPPAHTSSTQQPCDHAPTPPQVIRDRKDAETHSKPAIRSEAIHIPMLPATSMSLLSDSEGDEFESDGDQSDNTSQEMFDIPSIDGVADADMDSPVMQQYLFDLHRQREPARMVNTGLDECRHLSMAKDRPQLAVPHPSNGREEIPGSSQHKHPKDQVTDQHSLSDQVPSLVTDPQRSQRHHQPQRRKLNQNQAMAISIYAAVIQMMDYRLMPGQFLHQSQVLRLFFKE